MNDKYEFTGEEITFCGATLHRIRAKKGFGNVKPGDVGGWIEKESNLSVFGNSWVADDAMVYENSIVDGNAVIRGNALVFGSAMVYGNSIVYGDALVHGDALIFGDACVCGNARIRSTAAICGNARVCTHGHWLCVGPIGSCCDYATFFRTKNLEIYVKCGHFEGSIQEFKKKVHETYRGSDLEKQYMLAIKLAKKTIDLSPDKEEVYTNYKTPHEIMEEE